MSEEIKKSRVLTIQLLVVVFAFIFIGAFIIDKVFPTAIVSANTDAVSIVGFVPIEITSQPIDISASEPSSFVVFSEKESQFNLTSFRISGEVNGKGRAEIVLDNGLGQELLLYSNVKRKQGNLITGMIVMGEENPLPETAEVKQLEGDEAWFKISTSGEKLDELPSTDVGDSTTAVSGKFENSCRDTCYMNMKMQKGLYYTLKIRVDEGTDVHINELKYMLEV